MKKKILVMERNKQSEVEKEKSRSTDFAKYLHDYFFEYLPHSRGYSMNTIKNYGTTFKLLIKYMRVVEKFRPERIHLIDITRNRVVGFLDWIQKEFGSSDSTRNSRLGALHSFFKFVQEEDSKMMYTCQDILAIKFKKLGSDIPVYLSVEGIQLVLDQPNQHTRTGFRDFILMSLMYDTAARVSEIANMSPMDFNFGETTTVKIVGKGNKARSVPLTHKEVNNLMIYLKARRLLEPQNLARPLFPNPKGDKLTRISIYNIVVKYAKMARLKEPSLVPEGVSCHSFRHSKAMHMLEAGIDLPWIQSVLGHKSVVATEIYARVSDKKKEIALAKVNPNVIPEGKTSWQKDNRFFEFLDELQE